MTKAQSDQAKTAGLIVGVLAVFGFIYVQLSSGTKAVVPVQTEVIAVMPAGAQAAAEEPVGELITLNDDPNAIEFNPFRKVLKPASASTSAPNKPGNDFPGVTITGPSGDIVPLVPEVNFAALDREYLEKLPVTVDGVITGGKPVAVVRLGSETYVMAIGDPLGEGVSLVEIRESYVVFRKGKSLRSVRVGDSALQASVFAHLRMTLGI